MVRSRSRRAAVHAALLVGLAFLLLDPGAPARADGPDDPPAKGGPPPAGSPDAGDETGIPPDLPEAIDKAIEKGIAWLKGRQDAQGSWGPLNNPTPTYNKTQNGYDFPAGPTALAVYTLLKCGVPENNAVVKKGLEWLRKKWRFPGSAYETSMILLAVIATADPFKKTKDSRAAGDRVRLAGDMRAWAMDLKDVLLGYRAPPAWRYYKAGSGTAGGDQDLSSTQLAVLALFAAERCGIRVDSALWVDAIQFALREQEEDGPDAPRAVAPKGPALPGRATTGPAPAPAPADPPAAAERPDRARGFSYIKSDALPPEEGKATGGMTAGGVGTLMMARFVLQQRKDKAARSIDPVVIQQAIYDGLAWLDLHWNATRNPPNASYHTYYLYSVERAMDLVGDHRLGKRFWFVEMARPLVDEQKEDGRWRIQGGVPIYDTLDTCFALLFLHRAMLGGIPFPSVTGGSDDPPSEPK